MGRKRSIGEKFEEKAEEFPTPLYFVFSGLNLSPDPSHSF